MQPGSNDAQPEPQPARSLLDLQMEINREIQRKFPHAVYYDANNILQIKPLEDIEDQFQNSGREREGDGRGGNNAAQNIKKSVRATLKAKLKDHFREFDERYFRGFQLKSQKENYILIFLFLHQFVAQKGLSNALIHEVIQMNKRNIRKYIGHSQARMEERETFHSKNIDQLTKYLAFNEDFTNRDRRWQEVEEFIRSLFLKKKANAEQSVEKVLRIINEREYIKNLFVDFQPTEESNMDEQPLLKIQEEDGKVQQGINNRVG